MPSTDACHACHALCCVAPHYHPAIGFACEKAAHATCQHLHTERLDCTIHADLHQHGFNGCLAYQCHGAGPEISAEATADGLHWPSLATDDPRRPVLFERFLELQALYAALAELRSLAPNVGLENELAIHQAAIATLDPRERADRALELAMPIRLLCWQAELG